MVDATNKIIAERNAVIDKVRQGNPQAATGLVMGAFIQDFTR
jgi:hypothetical protein